MAKNGVKIILAKNKRDLADIFRIRETIFIKEQNVPKNLECDKFDDDASHILLLYGNKPVGCGRIRFYNNRAKLERIAILKSHRNKGFGKILVNFMVKYCKGRHSKDIFMNSQYYLKGYYSKLGFKARGKPFMEAGIKHIKMHYEKQKE